jgi:saccharopine dehydrogenase-like NADP-dependent oxidoreductase
MGDRDRGSASRGALRPEGLSPPARSRSPRFDTIPDGTDVLLVGCGAIGSVIARQLVSSDAVRQVVAADVDGDLAKQVASSTRSPKARALSLDAGDPAAVARATRGMGVLVNATVPRFNEILMDAALEAGAHYLDMASGERDAFAQDGAWKAAGRTALVGMGEDPGLGNVFARYAADGMDRIESIRVRDGETATHPEHPFVALFSPETLVEETLEPAKVYRDGAWVEVPPLSDFETFPFPYPVGALQVCTVSHEEVDTFPRFIGKGVRYVDFRLALDPGTVQMLRTFRDMGFLDPGPPGGPSPRKALFSRIPKPADLVGRVAGSAVLLVEVVGERDGARKTHAVYTILDHDEAARRHGATGTAYLTGTGGAIGAILLASGGILQAGVVSPESLDPGPILSMLRDRGIEVRERVTWDRPVG